MTAEQQYHFLPFADGVTLAHHPPGIGQPPPAPAGTRRTMTQEDDSGTRPTIYLFFPAVWHPRPSASEPLANRLRHLSLTGERRPMQPGSNLCHTCDELGKYIAASRKARAWGAFTGKVRSVEFHTINLPHVLVMGDLDDIMRSPECSLCLLVSTACKSTINDVVRPDSESH